MLFEFHDAEHEIGVIPARGHVLVGVEEKQGEAGFGGGGHQKVQSSDCAAGFFRRLDKRRASFGTDRIAVSPQKFHASG